MASADAKAVWTRIPGPEKSIHGLSYVLSSQKCLNDWDLFNKEVFSFIVANLQCSTHAYFDSLGSLLDADCMTNVLE